MRLLKSAHATSLYRISHLLIIGYEGAGGGLKIAGKSLAKSVH
jgi:hypothetical protein